MSIYSQLLEAALTSAHHTGIAPDQTQLVAELARRRSHLPQGQFPAASAGGVTGAVADQLAYDLALTALCGHAGVDFDVEEFERPADARARLELALSKMGIPTTSSGQARTA